MDPPETVRTYCDEWWNWDPKADEVQLHTHAQFSDTRQAIQRGMMRTNQTADRVLRYMQCADTTWVYRDVDELTKYKLVSNRCGDRMCPACGKIRSTRVGDALAAHCEHMHHLRFITLTLGDTSAGLAASLDRLYLHFRSLRATDWWQANVRGGAAFLEVKWSDRAKRWHPHFHLIVEGGYIPQPDLQAIWHGISKDSFIVDIRACSSGEAAAGYAAKYASKPLIASFAGTPALCDQALRALKGRRLFFCFGSWYGTSLSNSLLTEGLLDDEADPQWESIGALRDIIHAAAGGHVPAVLVWADLREQASRRRRIESG